MSAGMHGPESQATAAADRELRTAKIAAVIAEQTGLSLDTALNIADLIIEGAIDRHMAHISAELGVPIGPDGEAP